MSQRCLALHLHCYQPPRENPWLSVVLREPSAAPYHDWNERITAECYRPQTAARLLDTAGLVATTRNLYAGCSFNVGPTLHRWFVDEAADVDEAIRDADAEAVARRAGHGTAIGQPYVHAILPLADERDRRTLVRWGVADFRSRFGRAPDGMWLPETAVDLASLEALAEAGIGWTILAPQQVARVRAPGGDWRPVDADTVDPTVPYLVRLPSGRTITVCVFDGPLSRAVAFDRALLSDGDALAGALVGGFRDRPGPQLLLVATDGETYGHHHRFGEMALARALSAVDADPSVRLTTPGEFLARHPADHEAQLVGPSAWSCAHGLGRWSRDCGCSTGGLPGWDQQWRAPLRAAVDWLRDTVAVCWEAVAREVLVDPWAARDAYVAVLLGPDEPTRSDFLTRQAVPGIAGTDQETRVWRLLELQRHLLTTGTSCGWFFADPASLETAVVLRHAARVVDLARSVLDLDLEDALVGRLAAMRSNDPQQGDGAQVWRTWARGAQLDDVDVAAVWAALALLRPMGPGRLLGRDVVPEQSSPTGEHRVVVVNPDTEHRTTVTLTARWGEDGGPHVAVLGEAPRAHDVTTLPDDVLAELMQAAVVRHRFDGSVDAVLVRAVERGLDLLGLAAEDADLALLAEAAAARRDPSRLAALDAWVALTHDLPVDWGRFAAQNVVLELRSQLPEWARDPDLAAVTDALVRLAGRLGVAVPDVG